MNSSELDGRALMSDVAYRMLRDGSVESAVQTAKGVHIFAMATSRLDCQDSTGRTALHRACLAGKIEEVKQLCSNGANPNIQDAHQQTPLVLAAEKGMIDIVQILCSCPDIDVNLKDSFGRTALHWAAQQGNVRLAEIVLSSPDAKIDIQSSGGDTALHWACSSTSQNQQRLVEFLLQAGSNPTARNLAEETPADVAKSGDVKTLISRAEEAMKARQLETEKDKHCHSIGVRPKPMETTSLNGPAKRPAANGGGAKKKLTIKLKK